ncbi:hypothetical protein E3T26_08415 [Cryobacterium sp. TMT1-21]|uniref:Uncharacterized protein n=1 Tax=Cryobacterium shii TaxID=1259235 RepID=A0AAQ2C5B3_9MICO|nr:MULTISPECIES: hypothetical protein [Cryobacterium]TFC44669.1 hypothetical protein E3O49_11370 [Cryobacterium shii]TFC85660.1 hypothetical protein E3T24_07860 [Cryobacterium sp. TmT2-59]TFD14601.1 hypothetical protein E3T26_08415 [Cryobacterium sp. TMT1-21]TFD17211.1 hypothetical protein E3T32_14115 [Cryobacterium sp. TMT2-23]TFD17792.1 hypothetical protein E3T42_07065 [Cryobacterium sp. TMT4-10]
MSNAEHGTDNDAGGSSTSPGTNEAGSTGTGGTQTGGTEAIVPVPHAAGQSSEQRARKAEQESRLQLLRSKAAVARSEVDAMAAMRLDPETLEDLLINATPSEAARLRKSEHAISERVAEARARADAAEAEYEQAVLDEFDEAER